MQVILNNAEGIDDSDDNTYCEIFRWKQIIPSLFVLYISSGMMLADKM